MNLEELINLIEKEFPWQKGWIWLLRKDDANGGYFANIVHKSIKFPAYGPTRELALTGAYQKALRYRAAGEKRSTSSP